jgi:hypothetical protein
MQKENRPTPVIACRTRDRLRYITAAGASPGSVLEIFTARGSLIARKTLRDGSGVVVSTGAQLLVVRLFDRDTGMFESVVLIRPG